MSEIRVTSRVDVRLAPWPAEKPEARDDAQRTYDRPERASGHRRPLDELRPLADPHSAGKNEDRTDDAPRDRQGRIPPKRRESNYSIAVPTPSSRVFEDASFRTCPATRLRDMASRVGRGG